MSNVLTSHSCAWQTHDRSLLVLSPPSPRSSSALTLHSLVSQRAPPTPISNQLQSINLCTALRAAVAQWGLFALERILRCLWKPPDGMPPVSLPQGGDGGLHMFSACAFTFTASGLWEIRLATQASWKFSFYPQRLQMQLIPIWVLKGTVHPRIPCVASGMLSYLCLDIILMSWSALKDICCRDVCLLSYIMELDYTFSSLSSNHSPVSQHNPQTFSLKETQICSGWEALTCDKGRGEASKASSWAVASACLIIFSMS